MTKTVGYLSVVLVLTAIYATYAWILHAMLEALQRGLQQ